MALPLCFALILNGFGLEFWPPFLRPDWTPEPEPQQPQEPLPAEPGALIIRDFNWTYEAKPYRVRLAIRRKVYDELSAKERPGAAGAGQ